MLFGNRWEELFFFTEIIEANLIDKSGLFCYYGNHVEHIAIAAARRIPILSAP